jgi:hypothetical protein
MIKHGMPKISEYCVWGNMKARCYNFNNPQYKDYGGRGIQVYERWHDFRNFFADMGKRSSKEMTLDRIDNDGNYCSENCRWATRFTQRINSRAKKCKIRAINKLLGVELGIISHIKNFAKEFRLNKGSISLCLRGVQKEHRGWIFEKIL